MKRAAFALLLVACTQRTQLIAPAACSGTGAPIRLGQSCAATLAANSLRHALCSCSSIVLPGDLTTESGPPMPGPGPGPMTPSAAVGTDGSLQVAGLVQVAGAAIAASSSGMTFNRSASVFGSLHSGGAVSATQFLAVGDDAFVGGDLLGRVDVGGALHVAPTATVGPAVSAATIVREPISVAPPCDCTTPALDVATLVGAAASSNDDATISLASDALTATTAATTLDLPCGQYYLSSIGAVATVELRVHGRAALFVRGDVTVGAGLRVTLDAGAELDLVVGGSITARGGTVGATPPSSLRLWIGGGTVRLGSGVGLAAVVYAPAAALVAEGPLTASGALFVGSVSSNDDVTVRFDANVLDGGSECGDAPPAPVR